MHILLCPVAVGRDGMQLRPPATHRLFTALAVCSLPACCQQGKKGGARDGGPGGGEGEGSDIFKIVKMVMDRNFDPVSMGDN